MGEAFLGATIMTMVLQCLQNIAGMLQGCLVRLLGMFLLAPSTFGMFLVASSTKINSRTLFMPDNIVCLVLHSKVHQTMIGTTFFSYNQIV